MNDRKLEIIQQLMEELQEEMQHSPEDLGERLGRPKAVEIEMETKKPMDGDDLAMEGEIESPEEKLKSRLMKMRG